MHLFTEAKEIDDSSSITTTCISDNIQTRVRNRDVQELYYALLNAEAEERYTIAEETAKSVLGEEWSSRYMKYYFGLTE